MQVRDVNAKSITQRLRRSVISGESGQARIRLAHLEDLEQETDRCLDRAHHRNKPHRPSNRKRHLLLELVQNDTGEAISHQANQARQSALADKVVNRVSKKQELEK